MRNKLFILLFIFLFAGCGGTLKSSWSNFRAYYNTYYNAKKSFQAGLKKIDEQPFEIDPSQPVRIHHAPLQAGNSDFEEAINKGAKVLRKFPNSKWVDESLLLIGKSYYYQQKFYPALQKFEELGKVGSSPTMKQLAIIWKGRTLLDLKQYNQGIAFLEDELNQYPQNWPAQKKGEIQSLAGEHYAMLQDWEESANILMKAISNIKKKKLLGRTLFLYGQVLEKLERYGESYFSFSKVQDNFPGFEYDYWAGFKQAEVARKQGNLDLAISIFDKLRKDDKNFQRRDELTYQIARTMEMKGQTNIAEKNYKQLLYREQPVQSRSLKSRIYYRLGKINSDIHQNYKLAAAYFDTSSSMKETPEGSDTPNAQALAKAFNTYTHLRKTIQHADSLLWLGSLSPSQLDSVIEKVRNRKRNELLTKQQEHAENTLANENIQDDKRSTKSSIYGFLNYRNAELVQRAKQEFRIIWGDRPLVDDWRRMEAVQNVDIDTTSAPVEPTAEAASSNTTAKGLDLNLDAIPKTKNARNKLLAQKTNAQYQLGNLFFLNLSSPDSARHYFYKVIHSSSDQELRARSMYSLYELFNTADSKDSLQHWGDRILKEYPDSKYSDRVRNRLGMPSPTSVNKDSSQILLEKYQKLNSSDDPNKAAKLRKLALENRSVGIAPYIYYQAIESYIKQAKAQKKLVDSLAIHMVDFPIDSLSKEGNISDSTYQQLDSLNFSHPYWDSVRIALQEFDTTFTNAKQRDKVEKLIEIVGKPKKHHEDSLPRCNDLGVSLTVSPNMQNFLSSVTYPENIKDKSLSGEIVYAFLVKPDGSWESYQLVSNKTSLGIEDALEEAFKQYLHFAPLKIKNPPEKLRCEIAFPIRH